MRARRPVTWGVLVGLAVGAGLAVESRAQREVELDIKGSFRRVSIQISAPRLEPSATGQRAVVAEAQETLARDLIYSGLFFVMDQYSGPYLPRGVSRAWNVSNERPEVQPHRIEAVWQGAGADLVAELRLLDAAGTQLAGKRYQVPASGTRAAMHHFADQVVHQLTGLPGTAQTKIAFARVAGKTAEICTVDYDGFDERALTAQRSLTLSPCWGSGRRWIAFTSYVEKQPYLYRLDQGSKRLRVISRKPGLNTTPDWSDSRRGLALTLTVDGNAEIYSVDEDGRGPKRLTHHPGIDTSPSWSPTGDQIVFTSDRSGAPQIYVMDADGGHVRRVTYHNLYSDSPAWSPDGRWIAYVCRREGELQLVVMRPDGADERVVVREGANDSPSWANDSRHLAFSSRRRGVRAVYVVDLYSGLERRLTSGPQEAITPAWSRE